MPMPALQPDIIEPICERCCALLPERKTSHLIEAIAATFVTALARCSAVATNASRRTFRLIIRTLLWGPTEEKCKHPLL